MTLPNYTCEHCHCLVKRREWQRKTNRGRFCSNKCAREAKCQTDTERRDRLSEALAKAIQEINSLSASQITLKRKHMLLMNQIEHLLEENAQLHRELEFYRAMAEYPLCGSY